MSDQGGNMVRNPNHEKIKKNKKNIYQTIPEYSSCGSFHYFQESVFFLHSDKNSPHPLPCTLINCCWFREWWNKRVHYLNFSTRIKSLPEVKLSVATWAIDTSSCVDVVTGIVSYSLVPAHASSDSPRNTVT